MPYDRGDVLAALHREGEVLVEVHEESGTRIRARLPEASVTRFREFAGRPVSARRRPVAGAGGPRLG